jgi:hypothetical protein
MQEKGDSPDGLEPMTSASTLHIRSGSKGLSYDHGLSRRSTSRIPCVFCYVLYGWCAMH